MKQGASISSARRRPIRGLSGRALGLALLAALASATAAQDIGFEGPSFAGAGSTPTESKPENKLWFNDGAWWGAMWSTSASAFRIHRHSFTTHAWTDTGVLIESRANSHSDALWDGTKLYIASHQFTSGSSQTGNPMLLFRYSYNTSTDIYSLDTGFPVTIGDVSTESMTIAKDSFGILWAAWTQASRVRIAHSTTSDTTWAASFILPTNTTDLNADDLCGLTSFGGNRIGVAWSDQQVNAYRFSVHTDGQAPATWAAIEGISSGETDDHLNLATHSDGRVFLAGKNAANNLLLYVRASAGGWTRFVVTNPSPVLTRPCVILNEGAATIHVFATGQDTGEVFEKSSPLGTINFGTGAGTIRMRDASAVFRISNPTSTKDNWTNASGLVILAHHDTTERYWHHEVPPSVSAPVANFSATPTSGTAPLNVSFTDTSTGTINSRSWNFGDGGTSTATNPSHSYAAGTYTVSLTVTGPDGSDTETKTSFIVVTPPAPVANFSATPTSGTAPLNVSFTDTSTGTINSRSWNFGDGGTSTSTNPSHTYAAGTYTVTLTVTGPGGSDGETKTSFIVVTPPAPVANFSATPTSGTAPLNVSFTDTSTGTINSRSWSFGDGGTSTATNPSHSYAAGTYTVTLTVTGPGGSDSETKTDLIVVSPPAPPVANFTATPLSGEAPLLVSFTNTSTGSITSRSWDFGDGGTSTATSPTHTYTAASTYTVTLSVDGPNGSDSEVKTDLIVVSAPVAPVANFTATPTSGTAPLLVTFTDASTGSITSRSWDFGDGGTSTATSPTHTYAAAGTYTVTLNVSGPGGSDSEVKTDLIVVSSPTGGTPVLANPTPGVPGANSIRVTGASPNSVVGFYIGQIRGTTLIVRPNCPLGVPIGLARPWVLLGSARANASGVATLNFNVPTSSAGKSFHFQVVDQVVCRASNLVTERF